MGGFFAGDKWSPPGRLLRPDRLPFELPRTAAKEDATGDAMHVTPVMTRALALRAVAVLTLAAVSATAALSEPTAAQRNAIRSACRGDVQINCGGLRPDGAGALECLQENVGHLSPACRAAVNLTIDGAQAGAAAPSPPPRSEE